MDPSLYQTVIIPVDLGKASSFNRAIFPLSYYRRRDSLGRGDLYLDGTLDEILKISTIGTNPQQWQELITTTKAKYDQLMLQKTELEQRPKSKNPFKAFANYRAARMFLVASKSLYRATKVTILTINDNPWDETFLPQSRSEDMLRSGRRNLLSLPGEDVHSANSDLPPDASLEGIAIRLDRPLDDTTSQQILDAANTIASYSGQFEGDQSISDASSFLTDEYVLASESLTSPDSSSTEEITDVTTTCVPSSPTIVQKFYKYNFYGSIYSPNSNVYGTTAQLGGTGNSGAVNHTTTPPSAT